MGQQTQSQNWQSEKVPKITWWKYLNTKNCWRPSVRYYGSTGHFEWRKRCWSSSKRVPWETLSFDQKADKENRERKIPALV